MLTTILRPLLFICILTGCGTNEIEQPKVSIQEECKPYYTQFQEITGSNPNGVSCRITDTPRYKFEKTAIAHCVSDGYSFAAVEISKSYWERIGEYTKSALVLHELGHCVYNLPHADNSFMASHMLKEEFYQANWEWLISDFQGMVK